MESTVELDVWRAVKGAEQGDFAMGSMEMSTGRHVYISREKEPKYIANNLWGQNTQQYNLFPFI